MAKRQMGARRGAFRIAREEIRALGRDHRSGAAEIADRAAAALIEFLKHSGPASGPLAEQLGELAEAIRQAQPSMAPLLNLGHRVAQAAAQGRVSRRQLLRALKRFRQQLRRAKRQIARGLAARLPRQSVALTYSYSSTVLAALLAARSKLARVICSESRPLLEGRRLAEKLGRAGIRVGLVADAALPARVQEADAVVVGADAVFAEGYVNKIGTRVLQEQARVARKPFYVLADTSKILPRAAVARYRIEDKPARELWQGAPRGVRVESRTFERVPWSRSFGTGVVLLTERGPMSRVSLRRWAEQPGRKEQDRQTVGRKARP
jgi:translation initiation factor eIF-2B subunit delta